MVNSKSAFFWIILFHLITPHHRKNLNWYIQKFKFGVLAESICWKKGNAVVAHVTERKTNKKSEPRKESSMPWPYILQSEWPLHFGHAECNRVKSKDTNTHNTLMVNVQKRLTSQDLFHTSNMPITKSICFPKFMYIISTCRMTSYPFRKYPAIVKFYKV